MTDLKKFDILTEQLNEMQIQLPHTERVVNAADFGVRAGAACDNTNAFFEALSYCRSIKAARLIVPKGVYYFKSCETDAYLSLDEMEDFVLDGGGSEFIFESLHSYLSIRKSRRVLVKNLILDWNWEKAPLASVGVVTRVAEDGSFIECRFPEHESVSADMKFSIVGPFDPTRYTPGCPGGIEFRPYRNDHVKKAGMRLRMRRCSSWCVSYPIFFCQNRKRRGKMCRGFIR